MENIKSSKKELLFNGRKMRVEDFVKRYGLQNELDGSIKIIIDKLVKEGMVTWVDNEKHSYSNEGIHYNVTYNNNSKMKKKEMKRQYKESILSLEEMRKYITNLRIKCDYCDKVISPYISYDGIVRCHCRSYSNFGKWVEYGFNGKYDGQTLYINKGVNIISNLNKTIPRNLIGIQTHETEESINKDNKVFRKNPPKSLGRNKIGSNKKSNEILLNKQSYHMNFDDCFKKHFSTGYQKYAVLSMLNNVTIEEFTLSVLKNYNGTYDLEEALLGALIIHVGLGNIEGYNLESLLRKLNWTKEFEVDVKHNLLGYNNHGNNYIPISKHTNNFRNYSSQNNDAVPGRYDYNENGYVEVDGGFDKYGYDREGYDIEGYDELGYQRDDFE